MKRACTTLLTVVLTACGGGSGGGSAPPPPPPTPPPTTGAPSLFATISDAQWDEGAVRQVLHVFAFGSHATDAQIRAWADMAPIDATRQILSFAPQDARLSPTDPNDSLAHTGGTLAGLSAHWSSNDSRNRMPAARRSDFRLNNPLQIVAPELIWSYGAIMRGINPARSRMGLWETNYHMAIHQRFGLINDAQTVRYFDDIVSGIGNGTAYDAILGGAAISAAIAMQYGHYKNRYVNGVFSGNEDFGRELHQLFFGIFGTYDPTAHEEITIKHTARALTGMQVPYQLNGHRVSVPIYDSATHDPNVLLILNSTISGRTAEEKIRALAPIAGAHPESLDNIPLIVIAGLADDAMDDTTIAEVRRAWRSMATRDVRRFLADYAASPLFHSTNRVKYLSSIERNFIVQNLVTLSNREAYYDLYEPRGYRDEGPIVFEPAHNVFGGQTSTEAAASSEVFRIAYARSTQRWGSFAQSSASLPDGAWEKDWGSVIPRDAQGRFAAAHVARWLWQRFVADGLRNYGALEQAQMHALLASSADFATVATQGTDPDRVFSLTELETDAALTQLIAALGATDIGLDSATTATKRNANSAVGQAINFITATPYAFARQGSLP